jgi:hypothetical protein
MLGPNLLSFSLSAFQLYSDSVPDEKNLKGNHIVVSCILTINNRSIPTHALVNYRSIVMYFVDEYWRYQYCIPLPSFYERCILEVIDGQPISSKNITYLV